MSGRDGKIFGCVYTASCLLSLFAAADPVRPVRAEPKPSPAFVAGQSGQSAAVQREQQVEDGIEKIKTWTQLHALHRKYPGIDDGAAAEGYSDFVAKTLAKRWNTLPELQAIIKKDPSFATFILTHIDSTADEDDLKAVLRHAGAPCPPSQRKLYRQITAATRAALASM